MSGWRGFTNRLGDWDWYYSLPSGWDAAVHDDSQVSAPKRPTHYRISAICAHWIRQGKETYQALADAKNAAINLALSQSDECAGPATPYHYAEQAGVLAYGETRQEAAKNALDLADDVESWEGR